MSSKQWLLFAFLFECGLGVLAVGIGWLCGRFPAHDVRWEPAAGLYGVAAVGPMFFVLWLCTRLPAAPLVRLTRFARQLAHEVFGQATWLELLLVSLAAGFGEELLFRGLLQAILSDQFGPLVGLAAASVLFGLAHPITATYAAVAALIGVYLGWIWVQADHNLLVPILAHSLYDVVAIAYLRSSR